MSSWYPLDASRVAWTEATLSSANDLASLMRAVLLGCLLLLSLTGLALWKITGSPRLLLLVHLWVGLICLAVALLYLGEHLLRHRKLLWRWRRVSLSGHLQLSSAAVSLLSGCVLVLHAGYAGVLMVHSLSSLLWMIALLLHHRAARRHRKRRPPPRQNLP